MFLKLRIHHRSSSELDCSPRSVSSLEDFPYDQSLNSPRRRSPRPSTDKVDMRRNASTHKLLSDTEDSVFLEEEENASTGSSNDVISQSASDQEQRTDQNHNRPSKINEAPGYLSRVQQRTSIVNEPTARDRNNHTIKSALYELKNPLNVLVLGPHDSGKTTVINSLLMSVRGQWTDRARYGHGSNHQFSPVLIYENPNHHNRQQTRSSSHTEHKHWEPSWKRPAHTPCGRVTFWDTRGFERIQDKEKSSLILRYILEGRLNHRNFNQALLQERDSLKKMFKDSNRDLQMDIILYVASAKSEPNARLFEIIQLATQNSKNEAVRHVPILAALTKYDLLTPEEILNVDENMFQYHPNSAQLDSSAETARTQGKRTLTEEQLTPYHVIAYNSAVNPMDDEFIPPQPDKRRDGPMLKLFMEILALALPFGRRRTSSQTQQWGNKLRARIQRRNRSSSSSQQDRIAMA